MEEIKYRAWHNYEKKMYEVAEIDFYWGLVTLQWWENGERKTKQEKIKGDIDNGKADELQEHFGIELMQYVGIENSKGTEICEGDIIQTPWGEKRTVFAVPGGFAVEAFDGDLNKYGKGKPIVIEALADLQNSSCIRDCEVIGNIYENPELLKR